MIRLKDVAARAGVSLMTVSKVLRDARDVSPATKARIRRLVDEMGYVPDALARGLRTRRTRLLGLVIPSLVHPLFAPAAGAIENRAHDLGFDVLLAQTNENPQREELAIRRLLSRRVDGLFVCPVYRLAPTASVYEELLKSGTPAVILGHRPPFCEGFAGLEANAAQGSYQLCQHLIGLGHRRIAFVSGPPGAPSSQDHLDGYRRALQEANLLLDDRLVFSAGLSVECGHKAAAQILTEATGATAIQTVSDLVALGAVSTLCKQGWRIPEDMSVTGYGGYCPAETMRVPLTTVQVPTQALGLAAADTMQRMLQGHRVETTRLAGELVIGASTAHPGTRLAASANRSPVARG